LLAGLVLLAFKVLEFRGGLPGDGEFLLVPSGNSLALLLISRHARLQFSFKLCKTLNFCLACSLGGLELSDL